MDRPAVVFAILLLLSGFASQAGSLAEKAEQAKTRNEAFVEGSEGWRFLPAELRFVDKLTSPDLMTEVQPAVEAITDFSEQLRQAGVALVVVPVPPKALVDADKLQVSDSEAQKMREGWTSIMNNLCGNGVDVIDLLGDYTAAPEPMFCQRDTHWSGPGISAAVERLIPSLQASGINIDAAARDKTWVETSINGDLGGDPEKVKLRFAKDSAAQKAKAPVLLLGDSHVLVFHQGGDLHAIGAGLPEQLAEVVDGMPEVLGVRGSGATSSRMTLARTIRAKPDYLADKKLVVWVFAGREFTEADAWKKFPVISRKSPK
ncbi:MAG: alginate O-acetyltransferase AlgX-related protein [Chthoniobacterales bacterium]